MAFTNYDSKEINCKIVYFGPEGSGKTENLRAIYKQTSPDGSGGMLEFEDPSGPTKFFDFLPVSLGHYREFHIKLHLFTIPSNSLYESVRSVILKGVDGYVFVADARMECMSQNVTALEEAQRLLQAEGYQINELAAVIQYNKTDLSDLIPTDILRRDLNPGGLADQEAVATNLVGTLETLNALGQQVLKKIGAHLSS